MMGKLPGKIRNELDLLPSSTILVLVVMIQFCDSLFLEFWKWNPTAWKRPQELFLEEMASVITSRVFRAVLIYCLLDPSMFYKNLTKQLLIFSSPEPTQQKKKFTRIVQQPQCYIQSSFSPMTTKAFFLPESSSSYWTSLPFDESLNEFSSSPNE